MQNGVSIQFSRYHGSSDLLVLCSGRLMGFTLPRAFSFTDLTAHLPVNKLYIRDNFGVWYHRGLEGLTQSLPETGMWIKHQIAVHGFRRVSFVGVSSGAYAALVLGARLKAHLVEAIAPRSRLFPDAEEHADRDRHGILESLKSLETLPSCDREAQDLVEMFQNQPPRWRQCRVHFDPEHGLDAFHATRLKGARRMTLQAHPGGGHELARGLLADPVFAGRLAFQNPV